MSRTRCPWNQRTTVSGAPSPTFERSGTKIPVGLFQPLPVDLSTIPPIGLSLSVSSAGWLTGCSSPTGHRSPRAGTELRASRLGLAGPGSMPPQRRPAHVRREVGPALGAADRPGDEGDVPMVALAGVGVPRAVLEHL